MRLTQHEARQNPQLSGSWAGGDIGKLRAGKSGIHQAGEAALSMASPGDHSAALLGGLRRGGCARDQQRSNRAHTGGSSLLIPVLTPLLPALIHPLLPFGMFQLLPGWCSPSAAPSFIALVQGQHPWPQVPPGSPNISLGTVWPLCPPGEVAQPHPSGPALPRGAARSAAAPCAMFS